MKYIKYFENAAAVGSGVDVDLPNVAYLDGKNVVFAPGNSGTATLEVDANTGNLQVMPPPDYSSMYLTLEFLEDGGLNYKRKGSTMSSQFQLSVNGGGWTTINTGYTMPVSAGDKIRLKGERTATGSSIYVTFDATGNFKAYGNIMSMAYGDNFVGQVDLTGKDYVFQKLFENNTKLVDASNLILPATTLASYCYQYMFAGCTSLATAPALPATTLAQSCYFYMFFNASSLATAPALPSTTLAASCYYGMFQGCSSLTTVPVTLPATALTTYCYSNMFQGCTSLTTAPTLPATTLANYCYQGMFYGCTNLNYIKAMFTTKPMSDYTGNWVSGVAATGTFVKNSAATWTTTGASGIPTGWTVQTADA